MKWCNAIKKIGLLSFCFLSLSACVGDSKDSPDATRFGDVPVAYVMRVTPREEDGTLMPNDVRELTAFNPGARLLVRDAASPQATENDVTSRLFDGDIDVRDLSVSPDGRHLVFAMRAPEIEGLDEEDQPTWNIWVLDRDAGTVRRVIRNDIVAEEGQDFQPAFLPDGRIVFVSNRQRQTLARLLDEGKPQFAPQEEEQRRQDAFALHVMEADGSDIRQITFNTSHDLWPRVTEDGQLLFLRWHTKEGNDEFNVYRAMPDGRSVALVYGANGEQTDETPGLAQQWYRPSVLEDGQVLVLGRPFESANWSVTPELINVRDFSDENQPLPGQTGQAVSQPLPRVFPSDNENTSRFGRLAALAPLLDGTGRFLAAWSPCRLLPETGGALVPCSRDNLGNGALIEAEPVYGLWILDPVAGTQRPVRQASDGQMITEVAVLRAGLSPVTLADGQPGVDLDSDLYDRLSGILHIRSVFDFAGEFDPLGPLPDGVETLADYRDPALVTAAERRVRFLRITKGVLLPDRDVRQINGADFGRAPIFGMREIVGYVPVQPDGSVRVEVPANVPLSFQLVDAQGRLVMARHGSWLTVRPGETVECSGCHRPDDETPHGRPEAEPSALNTGALVTGQPFANTRPALFADSGETMAQVLTRLEPERLQPSPDMIFEDVWTDPAVRTPDADLILSYADLDTPVPIPEVAGGEDCLVEWTPLCRAVIHYVDYIQPLWEFERIVDIAGMPTDVTCVSCHSRRDAMGALRVPEAQLELTSEPSPDNSDHLVSYRELLFPDLEQEIVDGALVDLLEPLLDESGNPVYETDEEGNLVLDSEGDPVPVLVTRAVVAPMRAGSAAASTAFFDIFAPAGSHEGWLTDAERRLLSEWLDIGGQYYNDPFVVPQ